MVSPSSSQPLQIKDFFGLHVPEMPETYLGKVEALAHALPSWQWGIRWSGLRPWRCCCSGRACGCRCQATCPPCWWGGPWLWPASVRVDVATIGSKFSYTLADGSQGMGIPPIAPTLVMPWALPGPDGSPVEWNLAAIERLLPAAFSMACWGPSNPCSAPWCWTA